MTEESRWQARGSKVSSPTEPEEERTAGGWVKGKVGAKIRLWGLLADVNQAQLHFD